MARATAEHGRFYWCIGTTGKGIGKEAKPIEAYVMADRVEITPSGALILWGHDKDDKDCLNLSFASGAWVFVYAASVIDGSAVAVDHWPGQINER